MLPATDGCGFLALSSALLSAGKAQDANDVRLVGGMTLHAMGFDVPSDYWFDWGLVVRNFRARGLLIEDYHAGIWEAGPVLKDSRFQPPADWLTTAQSAWKNLRGEVKP